MDKDLKMLHRLIKFADKEIAKQNEHACILQYFAAFSVRPDFSFVHFKPFFMLALGLLFAMLQNI